METPPTVVLLDAVVDQLVTSDIGYSNKKAAPFGAAAKVWYSAQMSLGMVMFWKAVVLAVLGLLFERWQAFKKKRQLTLRESPDGVWRVDDRLERLETALLSETALRKDWLRPEEDEAWRDL